MPAAKKPSQLTITSYQVGFGDCYLLSFHYPDKKRHVLMDFGTKFRSKVKFKVDMKAVAERIKVDCGGELAMVVATHRHYDHISGFETNKNGTGPGDIIRSCKPKLVLQPWTEDPKLPKDATSPKAARTHVNALAAMNALADSLTENVDALASLDTKELSGVAAELSYLGGDNITNKSAVENLMTMAGKDRRNYKYLNLGSKLDVSALLPGVEIQVLGPPTLAQSAEIKNYAQSSEDYWKFRALAAAPTQAAAAGGAFFEGGRATAPSSVQWFARRLKMMRADSLFQIVRSLDAVMNNTSLILLFQIGAKRLLFPGDAQLENWSAALKEPKVRALLADVDLYKVGHHGSFNATPRKNLWEKFRKRGKASFQTLLSTHAGEYNDVPLTTFVETLEKESRLLSTASYAKAQLSKSVTVDF
jgi:hypothetical protein